MKHCTVYLFAFALLLLNSSCQQAPTANKDSLKETIKNNPEIITESIEANPAVFVEAFQKAIKAAQADMAKKRQQEEEKEFKAAFDQPLQPEIRKDEAIQGPKDAPITIVEYSDFECPFCERGYKTVKEVMKKYDGKIRLIFKHLPLSFHKHALPAAKYYEALRMQNPELAFKFHDTLFENQRKLKNGDSYLKSVAKDLGADMKKLAKDVESKTVSERIEADQKEAAKFGIQGTPGFVLNGIPIRGAYPEAHFTKIIDELKQRGKLSL